MNVLVSIAILGLLIFFHESGHFLAATAQGIKVSGFSIGFGPAIIKKQYRDVVYSIRSLPLGGFVSFPDDEDDNNYAKDDPNLLSNRPVPQRLLVISAGVLANLLIAWLVLFSQASLIGLPGQAEPGVLVMAVQKEEAAEIAGLKPGDTIVSVDNIKLGSGQEAIQLLVQKIQDSAGKIIQLETFNDSKKNLIQITPTDFKGNGRVGAQLQINIENKLTKAKSISEVLNHANKQFIDLFNRTIEGYKGLITNFNATSKQISGPVKIIELGAQLSNQGASGLLFFASLVSINLAILNSLPLPLLDGGQFTLTIIEWIRGKPISRNIKLIFMQSGFFLLMGLSLLLIIRDTTQLSWFQK